MTFLIPVSNKNQSFSIIINNTPYNMMFLFNETLDDRSCWIMNINDADGHMLVAGIPVVTGVDLLGQYRYLNIGGVVIYCFTDGDTTAIPTFDNFGVTSHLYFNVL